MTDHSIREARSDDAQAIVELIGELATFERLRHQVKVTADDILRDGFGPQRRFECLLAEREGEPIGFALFFHNYSTFEGRAGLYLEDIFVREEHRGRGIGSRFLERLAEIAVERECPRLELSVLHWNPARVFYERLGFTQMEDWRTYRVSGEPLRRLASSSRSGPDGARS